MSEHPDLMGVVPPICRDANRLLLAVERCVRNFPIGLKARQSDPGWCEPPKSVFSGGDDE